MIDKTILHFPFLNGVSNIYAIVRRWSQFLFACSKKKHQREILSFFALLDILFIYLFNSNASKIWIGCACLVIWYREIPHGPSVLRYNMCSMRFRNFNLSTEKVLAFIQFSLILIERNKPRWCFILFHPYSWSTAQSHHNSSVIYFKALKSSAN